MDARLSWSHPQYLLPSVAAEWLMISYCVTGLSDTLPPSNYFQSFLALCTLDIEAINQTRKTHPDYISHPILLSALRCPIHPFSLSFSVQLFPLISIASLSSVPVLPRWVTCWLPGVPVHCGSCSPDYGSGSVALTCSCALTARLQDGAGASGTLLRPPSVFLSLFVCLPLSPTFSFPQRHLRLPPSLPPSLPLSLAFTIFIWTVLTSPLWFAPLFFLFSPSHTSWEKVRLQRGVQPYVL